MEETLVVPDRIFNNWNIYQLLLKLNKFKIHKSTNNKRIVTHRRWSNPSSNNTKHDWLLFFKPNL